MGIRTRSAFKNDTEVLEILDSDEEMDVDGEDNGGYISDGDGIASMPLQMDWQDDDMTSRIVCEKTKLTRQLEVERIEYLTEIPSIWPVPRVATAYVLDLRDAKFHVSEKGKILTADALIKNKDQDSWAGTTGSADNEPTVHIVFGTEPVQCRRSRLSCRGCYACAELAPKLLNAERFELDPQPRDAILAALVESRGQEGTSTDSLVET